jgi:hypothetical protein
MHKLILTLHFSSFKGVYRVNEPYVYPSNTLTFYANIRVGRTQMMTNDEKNENTPMSPSWYFWSAKN